MVVEAAYEADGGEDSGEGARDLLLGGGRAASDAPAARGAAAGACADDGGALPLSFGSGAGGESGSDDGGGGGSGAGGVGGGHGESKVVELARSLRPDGEDDAVAAVALVENGLAESLANLAPLLGSENGADALAALRMLNVAVQHLAESGSAAALASPAWVERLQEACARHAEVRTQATIWLLEWARHPPSQPWGVPQRPGMPVYYHPRGHVPPHAAPLQAPTHVSPAQQTMAMGAPAGMPMSEDDALELALRASRESQQRPPPEEEDAAELLRAIELSQDPEEQVSRSFSSEDPVNAVIALSQLEAEREELRRERETLRLEREASAAAASGIGAVAADDDDLPSGILERLAASGCMKISHCDLIIAGRIGRGGFGEVLRGKWKGTDVALKQLWLTDSGELDLEAFEHEAAVLASLRHPNVVLLLGVCRTAPGDLSLVMEFCARGSLSKLLHDSSTALSRRQRLRFAMLAARGMGYLHDHQPPVIHRDLKPANLLVTADMSIKVADFGLSKTLHAATHLSGTSRGPVGTPHYCAPEILRGERYDHSVDSYAMGVCLWEIMERQRPWADVEPNRLSAMVALADPAPKLTLSDGCDERLQGLIDACMAVNPAERPDFGAIRETLTSVYDGMVKKERAEIAAKKALVQADMETGAGATPAQEAPAAPPGPASRVQTQVQTPAQPEKSTEPPRVRPALEAAIAQAANAAVNDITSPPRVSPRQAAGLGD
eukprot:PRCOL_00003250-RA